MRRQQFPCAFLTLSVLCVLSTSAVGCDLNAMLIKSTLDSTDEFSSGPGRSLSDPEAVGQVLAGSAVTNEGNLYYVPEYEPLLQSAAFTNIAYGSAWLGTLASEAEERGDEAAAKQAKQRAAQMFKRAKEISIRMLRLRDDGYDAATRGDLSKFKAWTDEQFEEKDDAPVILTAGIALLLSIVSSDEGLTAAVDTPYAKYLIERSVELDPEAKGALGLQALGTYWCTVPGMAGGNPKYGYLLMQKAMKLTKRQSLGAMIPAAERCAVALQDRKLFTDLLTEVVNAPDYPDYRLTNVMAKKDAQRLLKHEEELFYD